MKNRLCLVDTTLRDGGLVNDFYFTDRCARAVYEANAAAGVDYMEFGYRADPRIFHREDFGKWKFASDEDIRAIVGEHKSPMQLSVMCEVGRCDYRTALAPKAESPVDMVRVATYLDTVPACLEMIEHAAGLGYEATCNLMAVSKYTAAQLREALQLLAASPVMGVYLADSYGALYPAQVRELTALFREVLEPAGKRVGIHAHNNQQCAFANTVEAAAAGATLLDASAYGMGRGAGNCHMEALAGYFRGDKYRPEPLLELVQNHMLPLKANAAWGYNTSYLVTGLTNQHPSTAIAATKSGDTHYAQQFTALKG